jgi:hypothetical protein
MRLNYLAQELEGFEKYVRAKGNLPDGING